MLGQIQRYGPRLFLNLGKYEWSNGGYKYYTCAVYDTHQKISDIMQHKNFSLYNGLQKYIFLNNNLESKDDDLNKYPILEVEYADKIPITYPLHAVIRCKVSSDYKLEVRLDNTPSYHQSKHFKTLVKRTGEKPALTGNKSNNRIGNGNYIYGNEPTYWQRVKSFTPPWCSGSGWKDPKINVNRNRKIKYHINNSVSANKAGSKGPLHSMLPNDDVSITTSSNSLNTSEKELENLYQHKDKENCDHKGEICN